MGIVADRIAAAHGRLCAAKGGIITFTGLAAVDVFQIGFERSAIIVKGGKRMVSNVNVTALRSAFTTLPTKGARCTYVGTMGGVPINQEFQVAEVMEKDQTAVFSLTDART